MGESDCGGVPVHPQQDGAVGPCLGWMLCWKRSLHGGPQCSRLPMSRSEQLPQTGGLRPWAGKSPRSLGQGWNGPGLLPDDHGHTAHSTGTKRGPGPLSPVLGPRKGQPSQPAPSAPWHGDGTGGRAERLSLLSLLFPRSGPKTFI